jgi:hypothetical protein
MSEYIINNYFIIMSLKLIFYKCAFHEHASHRCESYKHVYLNLQQL